VSRSRATTVAVFLIFSFAGLDDMRCSRIPWLMPLHLSLVTVGTRRSTTPSTERLMLAIATESIRQARRLYAVGVFVTFYMFDGQASVCYWISRRRTREIPRCVRAQEPTFHFGQLAIDPDLYVRSRGLLVLVFCFCLLCPHSISTSSGRTQRFERKSGALRPGCFCSYTPCRINRVVGS